MDGDKSSRIEGERPVDKKRQEKVHSLKKPIRIFFYYLIVFSISWFRGVEQEFIYFQF